MIRLSQSEQVVWDAFFMAVTTQILHMNDGRSAEYIAERAAEMADEMLLERRERSVERRAAPLDWLGPA
ncbi:hypothetical protein HX819_18135 [Pseudomonas sp. D6002]|jgi:hypothetical protein|uniref:hypothetical protein n=1 Tax=unclassified Pseudomonas TaxID=196821 RepID=UPI000C84A09B|nr:MULTISPECIES: hypothetical protein [unclassified Pseudomonas]AUO25751.1 hypothetical protein C0058_28630 [Pseudomonas sp. NC02]MBT1267742.1 hypothetical protein [Pseudomonas sp. VS38]NVZ35593.1 hypothetical protein [Pseudomonas sp. A4002]NVZ95657.1 hypothetical protein [Pseudomonas sp. B6001]NWB16346.1 hypothetical protein [Pseudomonas sp. D6002]